jgi:signal transduction histidine kinase
MNIRTKITLIFTLLVGSLLLSVFVFIYYFSYRHTQSEFYRRMRERAGIIAQAYLEKDELSTAIYNDIRKKHLRTLPNEQEAIYRAHYQNETAVLIQGTTPHTLSEKFFDQILEDRHAQLELDKTFYVGILYTDNEGDYMVIISANDYYGQAKLNNLLRVLTIAFFLGLGGVYVLGRYYAGRVLQPISDINEKVKAITASNLHLRLPTDKGNDELAELAITFNNMLDRLETAFDSQTNFVNNASHELRNPLTAILGETEIALRKERPVEEYRQSIEVIEGEASRLDLLVNSLLELAQTVPDQKNVVVEPIRVDELAMEVKQNLAALYPENKIVLDFAGLPADPDSLIIHGNPGLLKVALKNVLDNACKFSNNEEVQLKLTVSPGRVEFAVSDQGVGIPEGELRNITDPFYRASNARAFRGFGVGLPLTNKIIRLHGGTIRVSSEIEKGTEVVLSLPA